MPLSLRGAFSCAEAISGGKNGDCTRTGIFEFAGARNDTRASVILTVMG